MLKPGPSAVDITPLEDGGVLKEILTPGTGEDTAMAGDKVTVHYVGKLEDGSTFDSSRDRADKFQFNLGKGEVIRGWDIGVGTMKIGEKANLFIKAEYGYGETGSPPKIPGGATLVFEVELFEYQGEDLTKDKDGGVVKRIRTIGEGYDTPNDGSMVEVDLKCWCEDKEVDSRSIEFELGEGLDKNIPPGAELGLEKMKKGEVASVVLSSRYGFGSKGCKELGVPANASLRYELTLKTFEKSKESWQLDADQKVEQAKIFKDKGTKFFKGGKYEIASSRYNKVIDFLEHEISLKGEAEDERKELLQAGRLNLALCKLKLGDWINARNMCSKVIEENSGLAKAYFRRGEAFYLLNDWENAKADFEKTVELDQANKAAKNKVIMCEQQVKVYKEKEKKTFANMFDKFAAKDQKREASEKLRKPDTMNNIDQWSSGKQMPATDPNSITVGGDINMSMDINQAIAEDQAKEEKEVAEVKEVTEVKEVAATEVTEANGH